MRSLSAVVFVALVACASGSTASDVVEIDPGEPFRLAAGEAAVLPSEDLTVRFVAVTADSRCPTDVTCIWAGDVAVEVRLTRGEEDTSVSLHTNGGAQNPPAAQAHGCTVRLEDVEPYPKSTTKIAAEDYVAILALTVDESE